MAGIIQAHNQYRKPYSGLAHNLHKALHLRSTIRYTSQRRE